MPTLTRTPTSQRAKRLCRVAGRWPAGTLTLANPIQTPCCCLRAYSLRPQKPLFHAGTSLNEHGEEPAARMPTERSGNVSAVPNNSDPPPRARRMIPARMDGLLSEYSSNYSKPHELPPKGQGQEGSVAAPPSRRERRQGAMRQRAGVRTSEWPWSTGRGMRSVRRLGSGDRGRAARRRLAHATPTRRERRDGCTARGKSQRERAERAAVAWPGLPGART